MDCKLDNLNHVKKKKFGHCPNEGGGRPLPELENTIYTFIFDGRKRCTSCPKEGEGGGGGGNLGNARKKTFFFSGGVPLGLLLNVKSQAAEMMMRALVSNWLLPQLVLEPTKRAILTLREVSR